jgi:SPFH domain / Band 7 family
MQLVGWQAATAASPTILTFDPPRRHRRSRQHRHHCAFAGHWEEVYLPKLTRQNIIEIGMRSGEPARRVLEALPESLILTGDENIADIHFVVFWRIRDAQKYLFNIQNPEISVKDVAESAMRDVVGQSNIQPILTGARQKTEQAVQKLMQEDQRRPGAVAEGRPPGSGDRRVPRRAGGPR